MLKQQALKGTLGAENRLLLLLQNTRFVKDKMFKEMGK
jgi:hypothetical protein